MYTSFGRLRVGDLKWFRSSELITGFCIVLWLLWRPLNLLVSSMVNWDSNTPSLICYLQISKCFSSTTTSWIISFRHLSTATQTEALYTHPFFIYIGSDIILKDFYYSGFKDSHLYYLVPSVFFFLFQKRSHLVYCAQTFRLHCSSTYCWEHYMSGSFHGKT